MFLDEIEPWMNAEPDAQKGELCSASVIGSEAPSCDIMPDDSLSEKAQKTVANVSRKLSRTTAKPPCKVTTKMAGSVSKASSGQSESSQAASVALM